jgi:general secretion pathway protein J
MMGSRQRGFTLVEMLIALSVSALLISLTYGAVLVGQRSAQALNTRVVQSEVMRIGWQFISEAITRARPVSNPDEREDRTSFSGSADALSFIANLPAYVGPGGLTRVSLQIDEQDDRRRLVLSRERFPPPPDDEAGDPVTQAVLLDDLAGLQISYLGRSEGEDALGWSSEWLGQPYLPNLIRIEITPTDAPAWPVLIARPLAGTSSIDEGSTPADIEDPERPEDIEEPGNPENEG